MSTYLADNKENIQISGNYRIYLQSNKVILTHLDTTKYIVFNKDNNKFKQITNLTEDKDINDSIDVSIYIFISI
jgi:hypothetical protein